MDVSGSKNKRLAIRHQRKANINSPMFTRAKRLTFIIGEAIQANQQPHLTNSYGPVSANTYNALKMTIPATSSATPTTRMKGAAQRKPSAIRIISGKKQSE